MENLFYLVVVSVNLFKEFHEYWCRFLITGELSCGHEPHSVADYWR